MGALYFVLTYPELPSLYAMNYHALIKYVMSENLKIQYTSHVAIRDGMKSGRLSVTYCVFLLISAFGGATILIFIYPLSVELHNPISSVSWFSFV